MTRGAAWGPGTDNINQKFTGQEHDTETGMDFFQARYYGSALGRFTSPDPWNAGADPMNPQSWNMYAYVNNNPLNAIDPSGLTTCDANGNNCYDSTTVNGGPPDPVANDTWWNGTIPWYYGYTFFSTGIGIGISAAPAKPATPPNPGPPPKTGTCPGGASAAGLTYSPGVQQHIEQLHMIFLPNGQGNNFTYYRRGGVDVPRSQYYFDPSGTAAQNWNLVTQINAQTFSLATPQPSRGNVLFTATLGPQNNPVPGARPYLGIDYSGSFNLFGFKIPVMKSYTSTNTLVTRSDCQTVVSSYPGNP